MDGRNLKAEKIFMITVLIAAFVIRILNIRFGYPLQTHADEPILVDAALEMIKTGDLNPHNFQYPTLTIYLQALLFFLVQLPDRLFGVQLWPAQWIDYFVYARALNVLFSTATIYVVYEIARKLFGGWTGVVAMCFIGASSAHVSNAYAATVDTVTAFWPSIACLMAAIIYKNESDRKLWHYLVGGICVGLATSSKYTAFLCFLPLLIGHVRHALRNKSWIDRNIVTALVAAPVGFILTTPYALLDFETFFAGLVYQSQQYTSHVGAESQISTSFHLYFNELFNEGYGEIPTILAFVGFASLVYKKRMESVLLISFPLALFTFLGFFRIYFFRNLLPAIPFLAVLSAHGACMVLPFAEKLRSTQVLRFQNYRYAAAGVLVLLVLVGVRDQMADDIRMIRINTLPDTRWVSLQWIQENIPSGTRIGRERYTPPIESYSDLYLVEFFGIGGIATAQGAIESVQFMILSSDSYDRFLDNPGQYPDFAEAYRNFFDCNQLVKEFVEDGTTMSGPTIRIYLVKYGLDMQACKAQNNSAVQ